MALLLGSSLLELLVLFVIVVLTVAWYFRNAYSFWEKRGVPVVPPRFPLGNTNVLLPRGLSMGTLSKKFYDHFKPRGLKYGGVYLVTEPNLVIVDPDYVKAILCKDFSHFVDRGFYYNQKDDPISANLFAIDGVEWRNLRAKLTPTFTSGKIKIMFESMKKCCGNLMDAFYRNEGLNLDIKEMFAKYTTDCIGSCAFGIECNSFKYPDAEFRRMGQKSFHFDFFRSLRAFMIANLPELSLKLGITGNNKEIRDFFTRIVTDSVKMREEKKIIRNDFLQILMELRDTIDFSMEEMAAQMFLFFVAGFETSASTMAFALYELAVNPSLQDKLRQEVNTILEESDQEFTYENLHEMNLLSQVFEETLRKYPPAPTLNRRCSKDYKLPDDDFVIEQGTRILIPCYGLHWDPDFYPEPDKFDPERFSEEAKKNRRPGTYLPFGDGPRNCIGLRFGTMQSKLGIASVVKRFKIYAMDPSDKIQFNPQGFILKPQKTIYLRVEKI